MEREILQDVREDQGQDGSMTWKTTCSSSELERVALDPGAWRDVVEGARVLH